MNIYFSNYFNIDKNTLDEYGAFDISLINDLPVFIDPFLLFASEKKEYQELHDKIIEYIAFLRDMSRGGQIKPGLIKSWFQFPEVKQSWLGYSKSGNSGRGLGLLFANALNENLYTIFNNFGEEQVTRGSHLEKLCLIKSNVGRDMISDFTTNLIKGFLCEYTEAFALKYLDQSQIRSVSVSHAAFNYNIRRWVSKLYKLPYIDNDYVLLTPKDILTKDDTWISRHDLFEDFSTITSSIPNEDLRAQINEYFVRALPRIEPKKEDYEKARHLTLSKYPEIIDYYIRYKEDNGDKAKDISSDNVKAAEYLFIEKIHDFVEMLDERSQFTKIKWDTFEEAYQRVMYLKQVIENNDGYRIFYINGEPVRRESDLQLMFKLTWFATPSDFNSEVNNGGGPVDFKISRGFKDKTLVEFKLASNSKLKQNLAKQVERYQEANQTDKAIKVILYFDESELAKTKSILKELELKEGKTIILIDASKKPSASNIKIN
ncbi:MAG: hypothetical protein RBR32_03440 [Bacteroidales bacterium]|nr:hypothetical protein [Bacteroidales bacterium]